MRKISASNVRNFTFGVEDSLVSTVSLLSGVATAGISPKNIFITGIILIFVEAFSMGVGSVLSESSAEEYKNQKETSFKKPIRDGIIMFFSYLITGFIPLFPYMFFHGSFAFWLSIILSLFVLFMLGVINAKLSHLNVLKNGFMMLVVGGIAISAGVLIGKLTQLI